jgi:hypothetical protein
MLNLEEVFEKYEDEYLKFERIESPFCNREDLCAFVKLDKLIPGNLNIISAAEHDEIFLEIEPDKLAEVATEEDIVFLIRCGVRLFDDSLAMWV